VPLNRKEPFMNFPNVIADRYSSKEMVSFFNPINRVKIEREFWVAVLEAQIRAGLDVNLSVVKDYKAVIDNVDLASIRKREHSLKHDIPARLHEFNALAGHEHVHKGLTSRDLTENVERLISYKALELVESKTVSLLNLLAEKAVEFSEVAVVARTHNVPAQPTTVGKRFAQIAEELLLAYKSLKYTMSDFSIRGVKGPVGSQQDQNNLLGNSDKSFELDSEISTHFGMSNLLAVGQIYPRSLDFQVASSIYQLGAGPSNLALLIRLMASHDLATEGFAAGQVGSSAMPHKMNARSCERINGLYKVLKGYLDMSASLSGDQWNEGDVACSVVRRVAIPNLFLTIDGLYETTFAVIRGFMIFPEVIEAELSRYLPFLSTTTLLMHAVKNGMGREVAHEIIKEHAVSTAIDIRNGKGASSDLMSKLGKDERFMGSEMELSSLVESPTDLLGNISSQVTSVVRRVQEVTKARESDVNYRGQEIL